MITANFNYKNNKVESFEISGHAFAGEPGEDIVCAAVSTAVQFAECIITDVLGNRVKTKVNEEQARITLTLPNVCEDEDTVQAVLTGMMLTLCELRDQYPDYIEVMEVQP